MKQHPKTIMAAGALICLVAAFYGCAGLRPPRGGPAPVEQVFTITGYCDCGKCTGWERNWYGKPIHRYGPEKGKRKHVGITACGERAKVGTIAADTGRYPFGTIMYVPGYGYGRVEDRGGAIKGDRIDLYFNSHRQATAWGKQQLRVKVWPTANQRTQMAAERPL